MGWTLFDKADDGLHWPSGLEPKTLQSLDKKDEVKDIVASLKEAKKQCDIVGGKLPFPPNKASHKKANAWVQDAVAYSRSGNLKKVGASLRIIDARIKARLDAAARKKKPEKLNKKLIKPLKAIQVVCRDYEGSLDPKVMTLRIGKLGKSLIEADKVAVLKRVGPTMAAMKRCAAKKHPQLAASAKLLRSGWSDDEGVQQAVRDKIGQGMFDCCRDMSQCVVNLLKALKYGGDIPGLEERDIKTLPKLGAVLTRYGNAQSHSAFSAGLDQAGLAKLIRNIQVNASLFDKIASRLPS